MNERAEPPDFSRFFVKVPRAARDLLRWPIALAVYFELLSRARYKVGVDIRRAGVIGLYVGQCVIGRNELAAKLDTTPRQILTALNTLRKAGFVITEVITGGTRVTLCGYAETYDSNADDRSASRSASDQQAISKRSLSEISRSRDREKRESAPGGARSRSRARPVGRHEPDPETDYSDSDGIPTPQERAP